MPRVARWWITPPGPELYATTCMNPAPDDGSGAERLLCNGRPGSRSGGANDRLERAAAALRAIRRRHERPHTGFSSA